MVQMPLGEAVLASRPLESLFLYLSMFGVREKKRWVGNITAVVNVEAGGKMLFWRNTEHQKN